MLVRVRSHDGNVAIRVDDKVALPGQIPSLGDPLPTSGGPSIDLEPEGRADNQASTTEQAEQAEQVEQAEQAEQAETLPRCETDDDGALLDEELCALGRTPILRGDLSRAVEVASYGALVLAGVAGGALAASQWRALGSSGQIALILVGALVTLVAGAGVLAIGTHRALRLGGLLWSLGTVAIATAVGLAVVHVPTHPNGSVVLAVGATAGLLGCALWRNRRLPLLFLVTVGGSIGALAGGLEMIGYHPSPTANGSFLWCLGMVLVALGALGLIRPVWSVMATGAGLDLWAVVAISHRHPSVAVLLGLVSVAATVGAVVVHLNLNSAGTVARDEDSPWDERQGSTEANADDAAATADVAEEAFRHSA